MPERRLEYRKHRFPKGLLAGRSARLVVTMGMQALIYRWYFQAHGVRGLERSVLKFAGMKPIHETLLGMVNPASDAKRRRWLDRMRDYGRRLIELVLRRRVIVAFKDLALRYPVFELQPVNETVGVVGAAPMTRTPSFMPSNAGL